MNTEFTLTQKRALAVATVIAILFGAYFLRGYFILIVVAAVVAYLFTPLFNRLNKRFGTGLSATLTLLAAIASGRSCRSACSCSSRSCRSPTWSRESPSGSDGPTCPRSATRRCASSTKLLARVPFIDVTVTPEIAAEVR